MENQDLNEIRLDDEIREAANHLAALITQRAPQGIYHAEAARGIAKTVIHNALRSTVGATMAGDGRQRRWHIDAKFIATAPDGRATEIMAGKSIESGFDGVARWIHAGAVYAFEHRGGLPQALRIHVIFDKLQNLRPTITRRKGVAGMRYRFEDNKGRVCSLQAVIMRSDAYAAREAALGALGGTVAASNDETVRALRSGQPAPLTGPSIVAPGELDD